MLRRCQRDNMQRESMVKYITDNTIMKQIVLIIKGVKLILD